MLEVIIKSSINCEVNFSGIVCPMLVQLVETTFIDASSSSFGIIHIERTCSYQG